MTTADFAAAVDQSRREHPMWFALPHDRLATDEDLHAVEDALFVTLPPEYKEVLRRYGGGFFAFANIFSADIGSDWYVVAKNRGAPLDRSFVAVSENGTGDYYGFSVRGGVAGSEVRMWDHETRAVVGTPYPDLYSYLARVGLGG